ncbi:hypothetical protein ACIQNU_09810 [Streptomyces sp. NPDC091292]|uniref:hypothetical protein n=1 Tax=Streptomyces sp. NPDC091292 TaxID=3365991 RepID=UPI0038150688
MGTYLCSVDSDEWSDEDILAPAARLLDPELAKRGLPPCPPPGPGVPRYCDNLGLWLDEVEAVTDPPGAWAQDLDAAFYTALYLRAAEHALRQRCPVNYV